MAEQYSGACHHNEFCVAKTDAQHIKIYPPGRQYYSDVYKCGIFRGALTVDDGKNPKHTAADLAGI